MTKQVNNSSSASGGIGFSGALTILFVALKLLGKIDWSWWWVLSPLWITAALVFLALCCLLGLYIATRDRGR